ncbi:MAG: TonB-dependent receptor plug domain-containing protein [Vicinamibacterales bacterium]
MRNSPDNIRGPWQRAARTLVMVLLSAGATNASAEDRPRPQEPATITDLSLEELMNMRVTSVSKKEASLRESPAAIAVITQDDVRRLGITSLPEALRLVPGVEVARINSHSWAISARGFTGQYSDKLLVLIDGRIIYESRFPGVYWDVQDLVLEDLDRIEVIRGPGATLWGANAVNGVINIITKRPADTQGTMVSLAAGSEDQPATSVRYGGSLGPNASYRVYGRFVKRNGLAAADDRVASDAWDATRGGLRAQWDGNGTDVLSLQSDFHHVDGREYTSGPLLRPPFVQSFNLEFENIGAHALGRWRRELSGGGNFSLQAYYASSAYSDQNGNDVDDGLFDLEFQHQFTPWRRHDVVWGAGYRRRTSVFPEQSRGILWEKPRHTRTLQTAFVQDEMAIVPGRFSVTLGSKFEHNTQGGFSLQPSARAAWTPRGSQTMWAAISRAIRTPDLFESGARLNLSAFPTGPQGPVMVVAMFGEPNLDPERLTAYEAGYRAEPARQLSIEIAAFYNDYRGLIDFLPGTPMFEAAPQPAHLLLPLRATNTGGGVGRGIEVSAQWKPLAFWRLAPNYTYLHVPFLDDSREFGSPTHRAGLISYLSLPKRFEVNAAAYYVGKLEPSGIPAYGRADIGLTWRPSGAVEFGVWGQNLLKAQHPEFHQLSAPEPQMVKRGLVAHMTWRP